MCIIIFELTFWHIPHILTVAKECGEIPWSEIKQNKSPQSASSGGFLVVRAGPCLPLWSFSLIRKTELWKTNKPPAMQVSQHCFSLQKKTSGGIINVGSPTALIYTGGIHMDNNSLSHTKWNCKYHIGATCGRCLKCAHALSPPFVIFLPRNA